MAQMKGVERTLAAFKRLPQEVVTDVGTELAGQVEDLTEAIQRAAPVNDLDETPGQLRDSVHFYANPDRPLSYRILADAKDNKGEFIGPHVEHGHKARDGSHVPRVPFFFPTYRARKKTIRRRLRSAARKALKRLFPKES